MVSWDELNHWLALSRENCFFGTHIEMLKLFRSRHTLSNSAKIFVSQNCLFVCEGHLYWQRAVLILPTRLPYVDHSVNHTSTFSRTPRDISSRFCCVKSISFAIFFRVFVTTDTGYFSQKSDHFCDCGILTILTITKWFLCLNPEQSISTALCDQKN